MRKFLKRLAFTVIAMVSVVAVASCGSKDEPDSGGVIKCKVSCEVEYPESCVMGETIEVKLLSIDVVPERDPGPYVKDVVFNVRQSGQIQSETVSWKGKPIVFKVKADTDRAFIDANFIFKMSDNLQTYTSSNYQIKVNLK